MGREGGPREPFGYETSITNKSQKNKCLSENSSKKRRETGLCIVHKIKELNFLNIPIDFFIKNNDNMCIEVS